MLGEVEKGRLVDKRSARPGDVILLTKGIAVEGTAIIAREFPQRAQKVLGADGRERAARFLDRPGISVVNDALTAAEAAEVHAMHDPTEGGLLTGIAELAEAAGVGAAVEIDRVPVFEETKTLAAEFGIDPFALIASGALLIAAPESSARPIENALTTKGINCTQIGWLTERSEGLRIIKGEREQELVIPPRDEIARIFEESSNGDERCSADVPREHHNN